MTIKSAHVDLSKLSKCLRKTAQNNNGLESDSDITPRDLKNAWESILVEYTALCDSLPDDFIELIDEILDVAINAHDEYSSESKKCDEEEEEESDVLIASR
jgi:hypothetical protein